MVIWQEPQAASTGQAARTTHAKEARQEGSGPLVAGEGVGKDGLQALRVTAKVLHSGARAGSAPRRPERSGQGRA